MHPNHHIKTAAAIALSLSAITPTVASAKPVGPEPVPFSYSQPTPIVRVIAPQSGFDWGDAGIGAAGGVALTMLGIGTALAISSQRRPRHPNIPPAPTG
jgi:hypothetical protein